MSEMMGAEEITAESVLADGNLSQLAEQWALVRLLVKHGVIELDELMSEKRTAAMVVAAVTRQMHSMMSDSFLSSMNGREDEEVDEAFTRKLESFADYGDEYMRNGTVPDDE